MACETEMILGCGGTLKVAYHQDNRLGNVNHAAVAEAVATLPPAFAKGAGGKQIWLWLSFPLMIAGFVTMGIVVMKLFATAGAAHVTVGPGTADNNCGEMGEPGWYECRKNEMTGHAEQNGNVMMNGFAISAGVMIAWFASSVCLMCLRASAVNDGFEGLQRKLGELNQKMTPLNFSMRTDVHQSYDYSGTDHSPGNRRTRIIYRYFLVIMNSTGGGGAWKDYPRTRGLQDEEVGEEETDEEEEEEEEEEDDDESNSRRCIIS